MAGMFGRADLADYAPFVAEVTNSWAEVLSTSYTVHHGVALLATQCAENPSVACPHWTNNCNTWEAHIAQMVERSTCNAEVRGSIPRVGTILKSQATCGHQHCQLGVCGFTVQYHQHMVINTTADRWSRRVLAKVIHGVCSQQRYCLSMH